MLHLHHQFANLGSQFPVFSLQLAFSRRRLVFQLTFPMPLSPVLNQTPRDLILPGRLTRTDLSTLNLLQDAVTQFWGKLATILSHSGTSAVQPAATVLWKNAASVDSKKQIPPMLGKASHTTLGFPTFSTAPTATIITTRIRPELLVLNCRRKLSSWRGALQPSYS